MRIERHETDLLFAANRELLAEAQRLEVPLAHAEAPAGRLDPREGACLYVLARRAARLGNAVEIGSLTGRSTWFLAKALEHAGSPYRVVAIDPHLEGTERELAANLALTGIAGRVDARTAYSHEVAPGFDEPIGVLFVDGDHSYEGVSRDLADWFPRLAEGGWVAFHDTVSQFPGTTRLVREALRRDDLERIGLVGTIVFARKTRPRPANRLRALPGRAAFELVAALWAWRWRRGRR